MSELVIPRNLSLPARLVLAWSFTCIDEEGFIAPLGKPPSAMTRLVRLTGLHAASVRYALRELEEASLMQTQVIGLGRGRSTIMRIQVLLSMLKVIDGCEACGSPARGAGRWCARCKQIEGRDDRRWQVKAKEQFLLGVSPTLIASRLDVPLFVGSAKDGRSPNGGAVVAYLAEDPDTRPFLDREWIDKLHERRKGSVVEDE